MVRNVEGFQGQPRLRNLGKNKIEIAVEVTENDCVEVWEAEEETREGFQGCVSDCESVMEMISDGKKSVAD